MAAKGSIILKLLILVFIAALAMVIYIPGKIWEEERWLTKTSRYNMESIFEAEEFYHSKAKAYVPADSLEKLVSFIQQDSALQLTQKVGRLTNVLKDSIQRVLEVPAIKAIRPIIQSLNEIKGDLEFNARYFDKYDHVSARARQIGNDLRAFSQSPEFPSFIKLIVYVDSLSTLSDRINEYKLQNAALFAQRYIDTTGTYLPKMELDRVQQFWGNTYTEIATLVKDIKNTDIALVSTVGDRLKKFIDRIDAGMSDLAKVDRQANVRELERYKSGVENVYNYFISNEFLATQNTGILQLEERDSILVKFNEANFYDPDTIDGVQRYIVHIDQNSLTVESPNLLDWFQRDLQNAVEPIQDLSFYPYVGKIRTMLDSTISEMNKIKNEYRLSRYSTEVLLNMKEVIAEMQNLDNVKFYRYVSNLNKFVTGIQTERRLSVLKPLIEDILNPMDTLATRIENRNIQDLEARLAYFGKKIQALDSLVAENDKIPARTKRRMPTFASTYQGADSLLNALKNSLNPADGKKMRDAAVVIEKVLLNTLNGYKERVYVVFTREHINHGYIQNGSKSWESQ